MCASLCACNVKYWQNLWTKRVCVNAHTLFILWTERLRACYNKTIKLKNALRGEVEKNEASRNRLTDDFGRKGGHCLRQRLLDHKAVRKVRLAVDHADGRTSRSAQEERQKRQEGQKEKERSARQLRACDLHASGGDGRLLVGSRGRVQDGQRDRGRVHSRKGIRAARSRCQHQAFAAVRPQLRVLLRRPLSCGQVRRSIHKRRSVQGRRHVAQTLRGQLAGGVPHDRQRVRRRAHVARSLSHSIRDRGQRGSAVDDHERVQPPQRRVLLAERVAAKEGAARRMGIPRSRCHRLGRERGQGARHQGGDRPRDALVGQVQSAQDQGGDRRRLAQTGGAGRSGRPHRRSRAQIQGDARERKG